MIDKSKTICMAELTEEEREEFVNSFPCGRMRKVYETLKAEGAYNNLTPPSPFNPMEEIKKLSAEIERLKQQQNASTT